MPVGLRIALLLGVGLVGVAPAADWSRFRGPNGTGVSDDKHILVKWNEKDVLFKTKLPGGGNSSPIVVNGKVFLQAATNKQRLLVCVDAETGKQIWAKDVPGIVGKYQHKKSSLANTTPCSDGKKVYAVFWDGERVGLYAYDFAGELVWKKDLGSFTSQHGPGFSPMLYQNGKTSLVIVNNDQDGSAVLQAYDTEKGELVWEKTRPAFRACYSTPFVHEKKAGGTELIVTSTAGITGYEPTSGKELWNYKWSFPAMPLRTVASSVLANGMVFACSGDGKGDRAMIAVKLSGSGDITEKGLAWSLDANTPYVPTLLVKGDHLYTVTDEGVAICRETKTGKETWKGRVTGATSASPLLIDGKVFMVGELGDVAVFEASPNGLKLLAKNNVGEGVRATPAVANGRLYIRGAQNLICIGKRDK